MKNDSIFVSHTYKKLICVPPPPFRVFSILSVTILYTVKLQFYVPEIYVFYSQQIFELSNFLSNNFFVSAKI